MSTEIQTEEPLSCGLENAQTRAHLDLMDDLARLGVSENIEIPQLVIIGDQGTGKSSVLQAVTDFPFAIDDGMCTRFATEIVLRRTPSEAPSITVSIMPSHDETPERKEELLSWKPENFPSDGNLTETTMQSIVSEAEDVIFGNFIKRPSTFGNVPSKKSSFETPTKQTPGPDSLTVNMPPTPSPSPSRRRAHAPSSTNSDGSLSVSSVSNTMLSGGTSGLYGDYFGASPSHRKKSRLSNSILRITRSGPNETNLVIVDIPGLVRGNDSNEERKTAKNLVQKYLSNPRSIVLVVIDVMDIEGQRTFQIFDDLPDEESRVIGVINKCDTKQTNSHDWVFDLIRNDPKKSVRYLKEGWYGLRNRQSTEQDVSDEVRDQNEQELFQSEDWKVLDQSKLGRTQLKEALIRIRNHHLDRTIRRLSPKIETRSQTCRARLETLGRSRSNQRAQFLFLHQIATAYSAKVGSALEGRYNHLESQHSFARQRVLTALDEFHDKLQGVIPELPFRTATEDLNAISPSTKDLWASIFTELPTYKWIHEHVDNYRASADRRRVNAQVQAKLWQKQVIQWEGIAHESLRQIMNIINDTNEAIFIEACADSVIRARLMEWLQGQTEYIKASTDAVEESKRLWEGERDCDMFTLQRRKQMLETHYRNERIMTIVRKFPWEATATLNETESGIQFVTNMFYSNPQLSCVLENHDSLRAYHEIALGRFVDNFGMQVVERHLLGPRGPLRLFNPEFIAENFYGPENADILNSLVGEDSEIVQERKDLEAEEASLEESRMKLQNFRLL